MTTDPLTGGVALRRYRVEGLAAHGGMASVYRATDPVLHRLVALKVLHAHLASDPSCVTRFRREALAAAALSHPNIVSIFDTGDLADRPCLVMEYLPGGSLADRLGRGRLTPGQAVAVGVPVARALHEAHRNGLVHRDVKPANILFTESGTAKLGDFGIAKTGPDGLTQTGQVIGTARYLAPEQLRGHPASPQSDQFALGVVLYESLAGRPPFGGNDDPTGGLVRSRAVPRLSELALVPHALEAVISRAMADDPRQRFPDLEAMARGLAASLAFAPRPETVPGTPGWPSGGSVLPAPAGPYGGAGPAEPHGGAASPAPAGPYGGASPGAAGGPYVGADRPGATPTRLDAGSLPPAQGGHEPYPSAAAPGPARARRRGRVTILVVLALVLVGALVLAAVLATKGDHALSPLNPGGGSTGAGAGPLKLVAAKDFDPPPGDGIEHPLEVANAIDGNPATVWNTERYDDQFPKLKPGVGIWVDLGGSHRIASVKVISPSSGWKAEVRVSDDPSPPDAADGWRKVGDLSATRPSATVDAQARRVLIWITQLPPQLQMAIGEIQVVGT